MIRKILLALILVSFCKQSAAAADSISKVETIYPGESTSTSAVIEDQLLTVHFIDVGGGDAILIDTPSDKKILIDGGYNYIDRSKAKKEYLAYLERFLGDDVVDLIIISHPDYDHFAALKNILEDHVVRQIWYSGYDSAELSSSWGTLLKEINDKEGVLFLSPLDNYINIGSIIRFDNSGTPGANDDVVLTIINTKRLIPKTAYNGIRNLNESQQRNSSSIVVRLDYGKTSFLFTGDTNGRDKDDDDINLIDDQELFMVDNNRNPDNPLYQKLDCTVLKVAHHGSNGSSSLDYLKAVTPEWAVVSAGVYHDHPDDGVMERLKHADVGLDDDHILRTDDNEDSDDESTEANLGDDCYMFIVSSEEILKIEKWNVKIDN